MIADMLMSPKNPANEMRIAASIGPITGCSGSESANGPACRPKVVSHGEMRGASMTMTSIPPKKPSQVLLGEIAGVMRCRL